MEIQTFFLAQEITRSGHRHDVHHAALSRIDCSPTAKFPTRFTLPALIVLRRENTTGEALIRLRIDLVDEDGRAAGEPRDMRIESVFPDDKRFFHLLANLPLEIPRPGRYRLDVTVDDEVQEGVCTYAFDVLPPGVV